MFESMTQPDMTIYQILLWAVPVLLGLLGFIGALMVNQLMNLVKSVNEIKVTIAGISSSHDDLKDRVTKIEDKVFPV